MSQIKHKLPVFLSTKEIEILLKHIKRERHRLGFYLMAHAGLRVSEMCSVKVSDCNLARGFLRIIGKGSKERIVPLTSKLQSLIEQYLQKYGHLLSSDSYLIGGNRRSWHDMIKKYAKQSLARSDVHCHTLRHSFATNLYDEGIQIERISQLLGHARLDTTMIYAHISLSQKKDAVMVLDHPRTRFIRKFISPLRRTVHQIAVNEYSDLIGRETEMKDLASFAEKGVSVILHGSKGCGKSAILKNYIPEDTAVVRIHEYKKKLSLIKIILSSRNIDDPDIAKEVEKQLKKMSIDELLNEIGDIKRIIIFDDITDLARSDRKVVAKLSEKTTVIAATSRHTDKKLFHTYLEIKPLRRFHARIVLSEMIQMNDVEKKERIIDDILHTAGDNIKEAEYIARQLQLGKETQDISTDERVQNQVSIAPILVIVILFFTAWVLKSYATSMVAFSYAILVVFRLVFYRYIFTPAISKVRR